ncbi:hypothetical protein SCLARK_00960 [Spiroplasma clarkii]|uniref:Uncharacterized protein n=1 Tax=Spiroplasma clarkii TaxID=2139 RepID=A0A1Y0L1F5_9MOLU|nr:hypothetical protein [Spiroplasma clarkii]ARU91565.1 hypothetical protein SCLARK_00960 [Spiroplasma clarkii]ATX70965.1 hypothetical protein SCLAR_v1c06480 [Spiroplasma clarkii]
MGYYYRHEFKFSDHSIQRIKQRLNLGNSEEYLLKEKVLDMIEKSTKCFETSTHLYIHTKKQDIYFVIKLPEKLIITATPISIAKQLQLIESDG